jgi:hypothetical protein
MTFPLARPLSRLAAALAGAAGLLSLDAYAGPQFVVEPATAGNGSVWDIVISRDPQQKWLFLADGCNNQVLTLERESGAVKGTPGRPGRYAGEFHWVHDLAIDSRGNLYAGEVDNGKRIQKFVRN